MSTYLSIQFSMLSFFVYYHILQFFVSFLPIDPMNVFNLLFIVLLVPLAFMTGKKLSQFFLPS